jgi:argininosuccinate lyase
MKIWDKGLPVNKKIEAFTVGDDYQLDLYILKYDCIASIAHAKMLKKCKIINTDEEKKLVDGLNEIISLSDKGEFKINLADEDCHTAIENYLTSKFGDVGKKIHTARSRNDQVLTAIRLYEKSEIVDIKKLVHSFIDALMLKIEESGNIPIPGYTHMQKAMPSSFNLWLSCYVESMHDNLKSLDFIFSLIDKSPLGTGAGFGIPVFVIDRDFSAKHMAFSGNIENPIYAQLTRGKFESEIISILSMIMIDLNKLASDMILYSMSEFGYITLPKEFCTGSSIMPQKKNPDVLELVRAKYHIIISEEFKVKGIISSLISGYNRDLQLTKGPIINSFNICKETIDIMTLVISGIKVNENRCKDSMSSELFATEEAYKLVKNGMPFRDAYKEIGKKFN